LQNPRHLQGIAEGIKEGLITPMSFEIFDWKGIRPGDEIEVLDDGFVIARGVIEDLAPDQSLIRLKLSYGRGGQTYCRQDGWQVRTLRRES
jgi:hypothetical protein